MIVNSLEIYIDLIERIIKYIESKRRKQRAMETPLGVTLKKVEAAQEHLTDALESIDVIREEVIGEKTKLDTLLAEVAAKRQEYEEASLDLETTQNLLNQDQDKLRSALGVNSSRERIIGFISGIVASVIATAICVGLTKLWPLIKQLWVSA